MAKVRGKSTSDSPRPTRPALDLEARQNQLIAKAIDLVEKRLDEGTASSQETTHFLKLGTTKFKLEQEILEKQKELIEAKTESLKSEEKMEKLMTEAIAAIRDYQGRGEPDEY